MTILCSGSLAIDRIMNFEGIFANHILKDELPKINISYVVDSLIENFGGTAGNIAYNLALLEENPLILSTLGSDGQIYKNHLQKFNLSLEGIREIKETVTATCYLFTDQKENQLVFFNSASMDYECDFDFNKISEPENALAIVSPGNFSDMSKLCQKYRDLKIPFIFDPGQQVRAFSAEKLLEMLNGAKLLITNEYELNDFLQKTSKQAEDLFNYTEAVITTLGQRGSYLRVPYKGSTHIATVRPFQVEDPTGAGDAYRAGLIKGLKIGTRLITACRIGSSAASFCVEKAGPQGHTFTLDQVKLRHMKTFNESW